MTSRRLFITTSLSLAAVPFLSKGQTCCAAKKADGAAPAAACQSKLKATNASVVSCDGAKTKIKIKCAKCGHQPVEIEIDTPTAEKPYKQEWSCPKCGFKQTVTVEMGA